MVWSCEIHLSAAVEIVKAERKEKPKVVYIHERDDDARKRGCKCHFCKAPAKHNVNTSEKDATYYW